MTESMDHNSASLDRSQAQPAPPAHATTDSVETGVQQSSSNGDLGLSKRPRDVRLIHMVLANMGVNAYHERVPVQLLDFCYRYTSSTLQDALHLTSDFAQNVTGTGRISGANNDMNNVTLQALRLSIAARTQYQFSPSLPKETMIELATEKNRVALPSLGKDWGLRLPPERYCLTGIGFGMRDEWESEGEGETPRVEDTVDIVMGDATAQESDMDERMDDDNGRSSTEAH